eukprot:m.1487470 g.1487470  ORF g.1487470 m.1487470 type:complete len:90 (+) comp25185_c1_seq30:188-457(+)
MTSLELDNGWHVFVTGGYEFDDNYKVCGRTAPTAVRAVHATMAERLGALLQVSGGIWMAHLDSTEVSAASADNVPPVPPLPRARVPRLA